MRESLQESQEVQKIRLFPADNHPLPAKVDRLRTLKRLLLLFLSRMAMTEGELTVCPTNSFLLRLAMTQMETKMWNLLGVCRYISISSSRYEAKFIFERPAR